MAEFTPGPWRKNRFGELKSPDGRSVNVWDAGIGYSSRSAETEANANLVSAAPELYEALKACVRELEAWIESASGDPECALHPDDDDTEALRLARESLAKAEGR